MQRRYIIIGIATLLLIGIVGLLWFLFSASDNMGNPTEQESTGSLPAPAPTTAKYPELPSTAEMPKMTLQGPGGAVEVNNFFDSASRIGNTFVITSDNKMDIVYQYEIQKFLISIYPDTKEEIQSLRQTATSLLVTTLGIGFPDACKLTTEILVPDSYALSLGDATYGNLGLEGCPVPQTTLVPGISENQQDQ